MKRVRVLISLAIALSLMVALVITYIPYTYAVVGVRNFIQGGNTFGELGILGTLDNFGLSFITNGSERIRVDTLGNIGIGTSTPESKLNIVGGDFWLFNNGQNPRIVIGDSGISGQYGFAQWDSTNDYYRIETDGTNGLKGKGNNFSIGNIFPSQPLLVGLGTNELFRVENTGNVGIGTTNPGQKLTVAGTIEVTGFKLTTTPTSGYVLTSDASGVGTWQNPAPQTPWLQDVNAGGFKLFGNSTSSATLTLDSTSDVNNKGNIILNPTGGNVGIGTVSPGSRLEINPTVTATADYTGIKSGIVYNGGTALTNWYGAYITSPTGTGIITNKYAFITEANAGNVGIGTASPTSKLHVSGTANITSDTTIGGNLFLPSLTVGSVPFIGSGKLISQNNTSFYWDDINKRLGIGTNTPQVGLQGVVPSGTLLWSDTNLNLNSKTNLFGVPHFDNTKEPFYGMLMQSIPLSNILIFGGGTSLGNSATDIRFITASNNISPNGGSERMIIEPDGDIGIGTLSAKARLHVVGGDVAVTTQGNGIILKATNGPNCYKVTVENTGVLSTALMTCP